MGREHGWNIAKWRAQAGRGGGSVWKAAGEAGILAGCRTWRMLALRTEQERAQTAPAFPASVRNGAQAAAWFWCDIGHCSGPLRFEAGKLNTRCDLRPTLREPLREPAFCTAH